MTSNIDSRVVSWYSWSEWRFIRRLLYNLDDTECMKKGIDLVNVWKSRLRVGVLPVSVILTADLISAYLGNLASNKNVDQARLSTAMALVRFVNGITDQLQTGLYAQSVQLIAEKINIPDWMVDLRHQATHSQLPGFELLQFGLMVALTWLDINYWEETANKVDDKELSQRDFINKHITEYLSEIFHIIHEEKREDLSVKDKNKMKKKSTDRCTELSQKLLKILHPGNLKCFVNILNQEGLFLLDQKQMYLCGLTPEVVNIRNASIASELSQNLANLAKLWNPLFSILSESFPNFYEIMFWELSNLSDKNSETFSVRYLVCMYIIYKMESSYMFHMIKFCIQNPNKFGFFLLQIILSDLPQAENENFAIFYETFQPVIDSINRNRSYDNSANFQFSESFLKCLTFINDNTTVDRKPILKCNSKWRFLQEEESNQLPPMGNFLHDVHFQYLDVSKNRDDLMLMQPANIIMINDKDQNIDETLTSNKQLNIVIENLFKDDSVYVPDDDDDTGDSDVTNEYQLETSSWVDFDIADNDLIKTEIFMEHKKDNTINASNIIFF